MPYTRVNWQDTPSTATPIDAANLNIMDAGVAGSLQADGSVTSTAAQPVSVTLSGGIKVLADWNATDGHRWQIREIASGYLEIYDYTDSVSMLQIANGKVWIYPHTAYGSTPAITLPIGDSDTGINWSADGHIALYSNGNALIDLSAGTTVNVQATLKNNGVQVPSLVGGGATISVQSTAPSSPAVGDVWIDTSISL